MITKENIQADLEKILDHIVQCGMLGNFRKYLEENRFDGDRYSNLRVGQRFYYNMYRFWKIIIAIMLDQHQICSIVMTKIW